MQIQEPNTPNNKQSGFHHPFWQLAFRSFFLTGALFAATAIALWTAMLAGLITLPQQILPPVLWHSHEMIFGFAALIAVGFIMTAVQTWTGLPSITGLPVAALLLLWVCIRILVFTNTHTTIIAALIMSLLWWAAIVFTFTRIVFSAGNVRNYLFVPMLMVLATLNAATLVLSLMGEHLIALHLIRSAVLLFTLLIGVVGGRVIPFFTARGANIDAQTPMIWAEKIQLPLTVTCLVVFITSHFELLPFSPAIWLIVTGCVHLIRMKPWSSLSTFTIPLLWSLHSAYAFMGLGLIALGLSYYIDTLLFSNALHLITLGSIGLMILAMISRVSLGHTGRKLNVKPQITAAFICLVGATLLRFTLTLTGHAFVGWALSAALWVASFTIFLFTYWPVLSAPRQ
ncbi:NnrS family protein [Pseudoalteromonas ruthenica]|uniref:NnrS family protein n=1 Tax=Pseudoalteromonas ruthenica TaxID=151081 RepID=A0A0F4PHK1_9GAMM|nr:NnrS family protein [Pseudoalteromonas ruthenica]KJY94945.1 hypothetical protein TW72_18350 [Pseudoalteromonas ruthenica]KJZ00197.1 hypothetical protein TW76_03025 [Pseudoalteromonas ruthenica]TMO92333.1 NnrS family protein [Pseudoalteromonas ruthenica]TMO96129.1 NnrS family protein [Pseudoalteromonas ruthenica]TMP07860.1 NnrS family protein [Pseudoalteromonas ruthenica]